MKPCIWDTHTFINLEMYTSITIDRSMAGWKVTIWLVYGHNYSKSFDTEEEALTFFNEVKDKICGGNL